MSSSKKLFVYRYDGPADVFIRAGDYGDGRVERGGEVEMADREVARAASYGHQFTYVEDQNEGEETPEAVAELSDDGEGEHENAEGAESSGIISKRRRKE